jgi:hypothetical protein
VNACLKPTIASTSDLTVEVAQLNVQNENAIGIATGGYKGIGLRAEVRGVIQTNGAKLNLKS